MSPTKEQKAFFDWLDEAPCTSTGVLVRTPGGETRNVPREVVAGEFRRARETRVARFPTLERCRNLTAIYAHTLEREERENSES
jgi:hypothetical protein